MVEAVRSESLFEHNRNSRAAMEIAHIGEGESSEIAVESSLDEVNVVLEVRVQCQHSVCASQSCDELFFGRSFYTNTKDYFKLFKFRKFAIRVRQTGSRSCPGSTGSGTSMTRFTTPNGIMK